MMFEAQGRLFDLVVAGGRVVTPDGVHEADVGIVEGRIAAPGSPGRFAGPGRIEARRLHVFPGLIDPLTHPGNLGPFEQDTDEETRAAAAGGITSTLAAR